MRFSKMHGLGNDFIIIDAVTQSLKLSPDIIRSLADRHRGIGCDQLLLVEPPSNSEADFFYRIYNSDGSEAENCGNGARCFARFVHERRLTGKSAIVVETLKGNMVLRLQSDGDVSVDMGVPRLNPADIPFIAEQRQSSYALTLDSDVLCPSCANPINSTSQQVSLGVVSMGNPHAVLRVDSIDDAPLTTVGLQIQQHPQFPEGVNVGFMQVLSPSEINLRVFERGVGETLACGTGACAAVVAGREQGWLDAEVKVNLPGGSLMVEWQGENHSVIKTGPATMVFEGTISI